MLGMNPKRTGVSPILPIRNCSSLLELKTKDFNLPIFSHEKSGLKTTEKSSNVPGNIFGNNSYNIILIRFNKTTQD